MKQLDIFAETESKPSPKRSVGRPSTITPKLVLDITDDINKNLPNKKIIKKHNINERTFFRIKKGFYNHLLAKAFESEVEEFSLAISN
jgi:hypothetical protein